MVDVVVNNVMATSLQPDYSKYMFKDAVRIRYYTVCFARLIYCLAGPLPSLLCG